MDERHAGNGGGAVIEHDRGVGGRADDAERVVTAVAEQREPALREGIAVGEVEDEAVVAVHALDDDGRRGTDGEIEHEDLVAPDLEVRASAVELDLEVIISGGAGNDDRRGRGAVAGGAAVGPGLP